MTIKAVDIGQRATTNMVEALDTLKARIEKGEFVSLYIFAFTPDHTMICVEHGSPRSKLQKIGLLECAKQDLINAMDTDEEPGL